MKSPKHFVLFLCLSAETNSSLSSITQIEHRVLYVLAGTEGSDMNMEVVSRSLEEKEETICN